MILKSITRYTNGAAIEATWVDADGVPTKCRAYDKTQMNELRVDLGDDSAENEAMIAECENDTNNYSVPGIV